MKRAIQTFTVVVSVAAVFIAFACNGAIIFSEDFEGDLSHWIGQGGGPHHGMIVPDPLGARTNKALTFTDVAWGGDLFTTNVFPATCALLISFSYLGLPSSNSLSGDFGGFLGIADGLFVSRFEDWKASTQGGAVDLADDGAWHHYTIAISSAVFGAFHLALEDFFGSGGGPGDVFFDNIQVQTVPWGSLALRICQSRTGVILTWPATATNFLLQASALVPNGTWTPVTNTPVQIGDHSQVVLEPTNGSQFFRLERQVVK